MRILAATEAGTAVRPAGSDLAAGAPVFEAGERLTPRHVAVLASLGVAPAVRRRPRAAVLSTGDEVLPPDAPVLGPGQIRDTNRPAAHLDAGEVRSGGGGPGHCGGRRPGAPGGLGRGS